MQFRVALEAVGASVIYVDVLERISSENIKVMSYAGNFRNVFRNNILDVFYCFPFYTLLDIVANYLKF